MHKENYTAKQPSSDREYNFIFKFSYTHSLICGPGSSVGIATGYGLDGPGIEYRWGRDFSHTYRPALGHTQPPV
jgi:hypothetical protein